MKRQESLIISTVLFPLLIFLFTTEAQARILQQVCSSSCGDINNISYPFRLKTDPPGCGDPDYELSCEDNKPIMEFHSGKYYVKQISYDKHIIRIVDVNLASGGCSLPFKSVSDGEERSDDRYRGMVSNTYTSFVRCSSNISDKAYRIVPCFSGNGSYVFVIYDNYIISDLQGPCSFISRVPTIYQAVMYPSYDSILKLMQQGFDLGWSVECRDCVADGGFCTIRSWDSPQTYACYKGGLYVPTVISSVITVIWDFLLVINSIARFILAPIVIVAYLVHKYRTTKKAVDDKENFRLNQKSLIPRRYSYSDILAITTHFKDELGQGGFGTVYKGQFSDGCIVAVKMLNNSKCSIEEFIDEVSTIGKIHHANVIKLVGFCSEGSHRALIFEYMPNGSLDKYILSRGVQIQPFSWEKLLQIALGTARGIKHLHEGCDECILHFDIKPHNVLLDHNFIPKLSDFGLAKFYPKEHDFVSISSARGTMGYIAPEIISGNLRALSCKSDVYSFGMLLLEMVGGRRKIADARGNCSTEVYFPLWVYDHLKEGGDLQLENVTADEAALARKLCVVGLWCIQKQASDRPSMTKVVEMLEGNMDDLQLPNPLSFPETKDHHSDSSTEILISEKGEQSL